MTRHLDVIDYHVAGAPLRVIAGRRAVPGSTMRDRAAAALGLLSADRLMATQEPRGHHDMFAAFLTDPVTPGADFGALICDGEPDSPFKGTCGHGSIALAAAALDEGWVQPREGRNAIVIEMPAGPVTLEVDWSAGARGAIRYRHVPSRVIAADMAIAGIRGALVSAGPEVMLVDAGAQQIDPSPRAAFASYRAILAEVAAQGGSAPELVQFRWRDAPDAFRSIAFFGRAGFDRSPCGTATSALVTHLAESGDLAEGETLTNTTLFGTAFRAGFRRENGGLRPEILATAHRTGTARLSLAPDDPLTGGIATPDLF